MTSPLNPFTNSNPPQQGSSPFAFAFPSPFPSGPTPTGTTPNPSGPSGPSNLANPPLPFSLNSLAGPSGSNHASPSAALSNVYSQLAGSSSNSPFPFPLPSGATPGPSGLTVGGIPSGTGPNAPHVSSNLAFSHPPASSTGAGRRRDNVTVADVLRGMDEAERLLDRAIEVGNELKRLEAGVFDETAGDELPEGLQMGMGGLPKLEVLNIEYVQLLSSLVQLSTSALFGGLPIPLSSAIPKPPDPEPSTSKPLDTETSASKPPDPEPSASNDSVKEQDPSNGDMQIDPAPSEVRLPTVQELTAWAERRAALEFDRREAIKSSGKAVVDVLNASLAKLDRPK